MTQYNTLNKTFSNSQLNKLKSGIKNGTEVTLKFYSNVIDDSNDENNFPHKLLLTNTQVLKLHKAFANNSSANIKLSKTQLHKIGEWGGFLGKLLGPLLKTGLSLTGNVLKPSAKSILIPLGLTAAATATDAAILKEMFWSGRPSDLALHNTTLIISNEEINDIMKISKSVKKSGLLIKGVSKTIKNQIKEQKGGFLGMLLSTLGASVLGNLLTGEGTIRVGQDF